MSAPDAIPSPPQPSPPSRRRWRRVVYLLVFLLFAAIGFLHFVAPPLIRHKLQAQVSARLNANLTVGELSYWPPFSVRMRDVRLVSSAPGGGELLSVGQVRLTLAKLPVGRGPIVIERLAVTQPRLQVLRQADGRWAYADLVIHRPPGAGPKAGESKLSDVLRLRNFSLADGSIIYQDRTQHDSRETVWNGITTEMKLDEESNALYGFHLTAANAPVASAEIDGTIDIDALLLNLTKITASAQATESSAAQSDPLPPQVRDLVRKYKINGTLQLSAVARVPIRNAGHSAFNADVGLDHATAAMPGSDAKIDELTITLHGDREPEEPTSQAGPTSAPLNIRLVKLDAMSGGAALHLTQGNSSFDPASRRWVVHGLTGSLDAAADRPGPWESSGHAEFRADAAAQPGAVDSIDSTVTFDNVSMRPPGLSTPLRGIRGTIQLTGPDLRRGMLVFHNLTGEFGDDHLALDNARVPLEALPEHVRVDDLRGGITFSSPSPRYPGGLGDAIVDLQPSGLFQVSGTIALDRTPGYGPAWELSVTSQNGGISLSDHHIPLTAIRGGALLTRHAVSVNVAQAALLGGSLSLTGDAKLREPLVYQGLLKVRSADVKEFARLYEVRAPDGREPEGQADLDLNFFSAPPTFGPEKPVAASSEASGSESPGAATTNPTSQLSPKVRKELEAFHGKGWIEITNGNLWSLEALDEMSRSIKIARDALKAGEAAAAYSVDGKSVYLNNAAISSPALGLMGDGTIGFDGSLNLNVTAAPLGDWRKKIEETRIPIVSDVVGVAVGTLQDLVNGATRKLLFRFRVTGTRAQPKVETVPAPLLTQDAASVFGRMLHSTGSSDKHPSAGSQLIDFIRGKTGI